MRVSPRTRAQSMVEFALVLPLFLGVLLSIAETARFMAVYAGISNGVRAGARVATITTNSDTAIQDAVVAAVVLVDTTLLRSSVTISPSPTRTSLSLVTVRASYPFTWHPAIAGVLGLGGFGAVTIQQLATMTVE